MNVVLRADIEQITHLTPKSTHRRPLFDKQSLLMHYADSYPGAKKMTAQKTPSQDHPVLEMKARFLNVKQGHFDALSNLANDLVTAMSACKDPRVKSDLQRLYDTAHSQCLRENRELKLLADAPVFSMRVVKK